MELVSTRAKLEGYREMTAVLSHKLRSPVAVLDYKVLKKMLPKNIIPAHDGLTINL